MEECFDNIQNVKKLKFEEDWTELRPKFCLLREFWAKYLEQNREIQKTGQQKKSLITTCRRDENFPYEHVQVGQPGKTG